MAALVGAAAAVVFGVGGALAVGTSETDYPAPVESVPPASAKAAGRSRAAPTAGARAAPGAPSGA